MDQKDFENNMILRDYLARDRTFLANERTMLAYFRTAIMVFASGITLIKLFFNDFILRLLGIILLPCAFLIILLGIYRYVKTKNKINKAYRDVRK